MPRANSGIKKNIVNMEPEKHLSQGVLYVHTLQPKPEAKEARNLEE